jgi:Putative beta-barrel porin-2, OmpL-like. bbp2
MKNIYLHTAIMITFFYSVQTWAADSTAISTPAPSKISWSGFVDVYYSKNFNNPANRMNQLRNFDIYENQFGLNLAKLTLQEQAQPVGFRVDLALGTGNDVVQGILNPLTGTTVPSGSTLNLVEQAYLTAVVPVGSGLTVDIGKFSTMMGYEVIESNGNWTESRSLLFAWAIPYYHMGMRLTYPLASNFSVALHIVNSWNTVIDNNTSKSIGLGLNYSPTSTTTITLNGMSGIEQPTGISSGYKSVGELIVTEQIGENFALALDADYGQESVNGILNSWKGVAAYAKYNLDPKSDLALRGEIYSDPDGYTTGSTFSKPTFEEVTLTYEYRPWDNIVLRLEGRDDFANGSAFISSGRVLPTESSQPTLLIGVITTF